jgi:hypothetical protein
MTSAPACPPQRGAGNGPCPPLHSYCPQRAAARNACSMHASRCQPRIPSQLPTSLRKLRPRGMPFWRWKTGSAAACRPSVGCTTRGGQLELIPILDLSPEEQTPAGDARHVQSQVADASWRGRTSLLPSSPPQNNSLGHREIG